MSKGEGSEESSTASSSNTASKWAASPSTAVWPTTSRPTAVGARLLTVRSKSAAELATLVWDSTDTVTA